jgi:AAA domain
MTRCPQCGEGDIVRDERGVYCENCGFEPDPDEMFTLDVRTAREIMALPEPDASDLLVGPLVVRGARTIVVADTGHGKTTLALQFAHAALTKWEALGYFGAGVTSVLVVDLEQGIRSIKRKLAESQLADREDLFYVAAPDGLALDSDEEHRGELERILDEVQPEIVLLDPYYKAHRGDSNEERGVVDLMRYLDGLRARYGFALILPAHPRKAPPGTGVRKLTLDDVAGSGGVTRGAELVFALERLAHGVARLRILKDRDGDLTIGEEWPLVFTRGEGFRLDPKEEEQQEETEERILELGKDGEWRSYKEYASELGIRHKKAKALLEALAESKKVETIVGPPGRSPKMHGYRTGPAAQAPSGSVTPSEPDPVHGATEPDVYIGDVGSGSVDGLPEETGSVTANGDADPDEIERLAELSFETQRQAAERLR